MHTVQAVFKKGLPADVNICEAYATHAWPNRQLDEDNISLAYVKSIINVFLIISQPFIFPTAESYI